MDCFTKEVTTLDKSWVDGGSGLMQTTRRSILDILKRKRQASVDELAADMELTPMGIRQHLMILQRDGLVQSSEVRRKTGRPHYVFSLSEQANELFPRNYHILLDGVLNEIASEGGADAVRRLLGRMEDHIVAAHAPTIADKEFEDQVVQLTKMLSENGSLAEWKKDNSGYLIREFNCPYHYVARNHRELCDVTKNIISRLIGADVIQTECVLDGAVSCTYQVHKK
jgi:predicted ArsR family transcriptional regulator